MDLQALFPARRVHTWRTALRRMVFSHTAPHLRFDVDAARLGSDKGSDVRAP